MTGSGSDKVDVSLDGITSLDWVAADALAGRYQDGWWIGLKVTAPADLTVDELKAAELHVIGSGYAENSESNEQTYKFWDVRDSADAAVHYVGLWSFVDETYLSKAIEEGKTIDYTWEFDWDAKDGYEQVVVLKIDPNSTVLKKDGVRVYPVYADVEALTGGLSVEGNRTDAVNVSFAVDTVLDWVAADPSVGRKQDGWWVGLRVTAPAGLTKDELKTANLHVIGSGYGDDDKESYYKFWDVKDSADDAGTHYVGLWSFVDESYLAKALNDVDAENKQIKYTWEFDWDADGNTKGENYEQVVTLTINPTKIKLNKEGSQVYPSAPLYANVEAISGGLSVSGNNTGSVTAEFNALTTLEWVAADPTVGRNQDGWWIGLKVNAPSTLEHEDEFIGVTLTAKGTDGTVKTYRFWDAKDSADGAEAHYVGLWAFVDDTYIANAIDGGTNIEYLWTFDWNKDGKYEQSLKLLIDPAKIALRKEGKQVYPKFAAVEAISDGITVTGSGSETVNAGFDKLTALEWVAADTSVGRDQDGWWIGLKVTAPAGLTEDELKAAMLHIIGNSGKEYYYDFWSVKDSADGADVHYVGLWSFVDEAYLTEAIDGKTTVDYTWEFDWDADDSYEQVVTLTIDPKSVVLNRDGAKVYPVYADVEALTGDLSVEGNRTGDVNVSFANETTLDWVAADTSVGRDQDGWWIGLKVNAPYDLKEEKDFNNVQLKVTGSTGKVDTYNFWDVKDSAAGADAHYVGLWSFVDESYLGEAIAKGESIVYKWEFDWDADGNNFEQAVTLTIDPAKIKLNKDGGEAYPGAPLYAGVEAITGGVAVKGSGSDTVNASFDTLTTLEWVEKDENIGRTQDGWWIGLKVNAPEDLKKEKDFKGVTLKAKGTSGEWTDKMFFWNVKDSAPDAEAHYVGLWAFVDEDYLNGAKDNGFPIEYSWIFDWNRDGDYEQTVNLSIDPDYIILKDSDGYQVYPALGTVETYTGGDITGAPAETVVTITETTLDWSPVNTSIGRNIGAWWIGIKVIAPEYEKSVLEKSKLSYISDSGVAVNDISFWDSRDSTDGDARQYVGLWSPLTPEKLAEAKANNESIVTDYYFDWNGDGTYEQHIKVEVVPDDGIVLNKIEQSFSFNEGEEVSKYYGIKSYTNEIVYNDTAANGDEIGHGEGGITYSLDNNMLGAVIDENTGEITFADKAVGSVKVIAHKAEDSWYKAAESYYILNVGYIETPDNPIIIEGTQADDNSGWYTGEVTIKPASTDYRISYDNSFAEDNWSDNVTYTTDGVTENVVVYLINNEGHITDAVTIPVIRIDYDAPEGLGITYSGDLIKEYKKILDDLLAEMTFGLYKPTVKVTVSATDAVSGVDFFSIAVKKDGIDEATTVTLPEDLKLKADGTIVGEKFGFVSNVEVNTDENGKTSISFNVPEQFRGVFEIVSVTDKAGLVSGNYEDGTVIIVDTNNPTVSIKYTVTNRTDVVGEGEEAIYVYSGETSATITVDEANFFEDDITITIYRDGVEIAADDEELKISGWTSDPENALRHTNTIKMIADGDYKIVIEYTDKSGYAMNYTVDGEYDNKSGNTVYTSNIHRVDTTPPEVSIVYSCGENSALVNKLDVIDGKLQTTATDNQNTMYICNGPVKATITVDEKNFYEEDITIKVYRDGVDVTDTLSGDDNTPWSPAENEQNKYEKTITLADDGDYTIEIEYSDKSENGMEYTVAGEYEEKSGYTTYASNIHRVDKTAPEVTVSYSEASNYYDDLDQYYYGIDKDGKVTVTIELVEKNFNIEDPFCTNDFILYVRKDDGQFEPVDPELITWSPKVDGENVVKDTYLGVFEFSGEGDYIIGANYTDLADHILVIKGDFDYLGEDNTQEASINYMYVSKTIVIDTTIPVVTVSYLNKNVKNTYDGRKYFDATQTAEITIAEHNFKPDEAKTAIIITAEDVSGNALGLGGRVTVGDWAPVDNKDDTYKITVTYSGEANYSFDIEYRDRATNENKDYKTDLFTVDKTAPTIIDVKYSNSVLDTVLGDNKAYGFYNANMTVTVTAQDDVAMVRRFDFSYILEDGVSTLNAELLNQYIEDGTIKYMDDNRTAVLEFNIPKEVLQRDNQFNGHIEFTATDRSNNVTGNQKQDQIIVVDNIAPEATVAYNEPIGEVGGVYYYDGQIDVTISITEANFYAEDVNVTVTKDGAPFNFGQVNWGTRDFNDVTVGTFIIPAPDDHSGDGVYEIEISYIDKSTNAMQVYHSEKRTIDTTVPVINVSGINHQSANNGETISITVSVTDTNIASENFKPVLKIFVKDKIDNNKLICKEVPVDLGNVTETVNEKGETVYSYTIDNLELDGYYSLECTAVDHANHTVSGIEANLADDVSTTVEEVNYSVNREGSVFWIETDNDGEKNTLDGSYAKGNVTIRIYEVNVDKVDENESKRTVFSINDGTKTIDIELNSQSESVYLKNVQTTTGGGGWYETTYTLDNSFFDHDGVYSFNLITYDTAGNSNINTKDDSGKISFTLDRTNPVISANIQNSQSIRDTQFTVEFNITETNLDNETVAVKVYDNNGNPVDIELVDKGYGDYSFVIGSGYNYTIEIDAKDLAGNEAETCRIEHFTVSTNILVLWYANKPLFWGSIGGFVAIGAGTALTIILRKKKKVAKAK
ncbi:MAG: hypothetical protein IJT91_03265 [Clostridia bacterium]|nr:hypothetical protein [Clostridia bacterium]